MSNKFTIDELEKQCKEAEKRFKHLQVQLERQKKEEEDQKVAELAANKPARKKEVDEACENFLALRRAYMKDYGSYDYTTDDGYTSLFDIFRLW